MSKLSPQNAIWVLIQMSRSTFYGSHVIEALQIGIEAIRKTMEAGNASSVTVDTPPEEPQA